MSGRRGAVANVIDFRNQFQKAIGDYEEKVRLRLRELQRTMDPVLGGRAVDEELEAHIRNYVIDPLLSALNWTTDENLTIETLVRSEETAHRRRLDYLGTETDTLRPLLVVEAKRPNAPLPRPAKGGGGGDAFRYQDLLAAALSALKLDAGASLNLQRSWEEWIQTLFDYVMSLPAAPVKVAMTNGNWLIVFENPSDAFQGQGPASPELISVYETRDAILQNAADVYAALNYDAMVPFGRPAEIGELLGLIAPADIAAAMRALLVTYTDTPTGLEVVPTIHLVPEMVLIRRDGGWFRLRANTSIAIPHDPKALPSHLMQIGAEHSLLSDSLAQVLGRAPPLIALEDSYRDEWLGTRVPAVLQLDKQTSLVILGTHTHFVTDPDAHQACPFHSAARATAENCFIGVMIARPSSVHVTHFGDQSVHHCAHRTMRQIRETQVTERNRENFGPRGSVEDGPFCKLWGFEHFLCCQTCAFRNVCKQSIAPLMPCRT